MFRHFLAVFGRVFRGLATCTLRFRRALDDNKSALARLISQSMFDGDGDKLIERLSLDCSVALHCLAKNNPNFADGYQQRIAPSPPGDMPYSRAMAHHDRCATTIWIYSSSPAPESARAPRIQQPASTCMQSATRVQSSV